MHPLVSISGIPGSGKSTLLAGLARRTGWQTVAFDDFDGLTSWPADAVQAWVAAGMPPEQAFSPGFRDAVLAAAGRGPVLIETPFGPLHRHEGVPVTRAIWLRCDPDIALARAFLSQVDADGWDSMQEARAWAAGYLATYSAFVSRAVRHLMATVAPLCDLDVDGTDTPERLADRVQAMLREGG